MKYTRTPQIPEGITRIINALYADFDRREKITAPEGRKNRMQAINAALRQAVYTVCEEAYAGAMLLDLKNDTGYNKSSLSLIMSHKTYYRRKHEVKYEAARLLGLI